MYLYIISLFAKGQTVGDHIPLSPSNDQVSIEHQVLQVMFHKLLQELVQYLHNDHASIFGVIKMYPLEIVWCTRAIWF
jgi:hypothetical protein